MPVSQPARAVMWACGAENTEYELVMTMPGSKKEGGTGHPDFRAMFPGGTGKTKGMWSKRSFSEPLALVVDRGISLACVMLR